MSPMEMNEPVADRNLVTVMKIGDKESIQKDMSNEQREIHHPTV